MVAVVALAHIEEEAAAHRARHRDRPAGAGVSARGGGG